MWWVWSRPCHRVSRGVWLERRLGQEWAVISVSPRARARVCAASFPNRHPGSSKRPHSSGVIASPGIAQMRPR